MGDDFLLPALAARPPNRLLVMLHGAGSTPADLVRVAIAWQMKLRSTTVLLPRGGFGSAARCHWVDPSDYPVQASAIRAAADDLRVRIEDERRALGLAREQVVLVGFSQGASVALELAFEPHPVAALLIGYAARLYRMTSVHDRIDTEIRLLHGTADSVVPIAFGESAARRLAAVGARVSLERMADAGHTIDQAQINRGTQATMDWIFRRAWRTGARGGRASSTTTPAPS